MAFRILFLSPLFVVAIAAFLAMTSPVEAQVIPPTFSPGCTSANAGAFDLSGTSSGNSAANFYAGERITVQLIGTITNSLLIIAAVTILGGEISGSAYYDVQTNALLNLQRDLIGVLGAQMIIRCILTPTSSTTTSTTTSSTSTNGPTAQQFQWAGDWSIGIIEQSVGSLFQSLFNYREAKDMLFVGSQLGEYGTFLPPITGANGERYTYNFDGFFNHHDLTPGQLSELTEQYFELKQKRNPWPKFYADSNKNKDGERDWRGLSDDDEAEFKRVQKILYDAGYLPRRETDGLEGGAPLGYAPVKTPGPLYLSSYDGGGQLGGRHELINNGRYAVWFEGGILTSVAKGTGGQSRTVGGGKFGFAARLNKRLAITSDIYVANGKFKVPGSSLTGGFTEIGVTMGPVIKLGKGLFLALSGRIARVEVDQTISGVTGDFDATRYAANILLGGHYVVKEYVVEPEISATFRKADGGNYITSSGLTVTGVDSNSAQIRGGARVSRLMKISDKLPVLAPFVATYANWNDFNAITAGGTDVNGFSMSVSTGVEIPVGHNSNLNLALTFSNLFGDSGEVVGGLIKFDKRW